MTQTASQSKNCNKCLKDLSFSKFGKRVSSKDGLFAVCKQCRSIYNNAWNAANKDKRMETCRRYRQNNPHKSREYGLKRRHNLTSSEWDAKFQSQDCRCKICGTNVSQGITPWHTDHCHSTGILRGILCHNCNRGLGYFQDNIQSLSSAIEYLNSYNP